MFIEVKKIPEGTSTKDDTLVLSDEFAQIGSIEKEIPIRLDFRRFGSLIILETTYTAQVQGACARCLTLVPLTISGKVSCTIGSKYDTEMSSEDVDFYSYADEDTLVDISQTVYEDIMTQIPQRVVCDESCEGFTSYLPQEEVPQEAETLPIDPRWMGLHKLKK